MPTPQGFTPNATERLPLPARDSMSKAQQEAADSIINGPRKAIFGPFVPLLQTPELMQHIGKTGETLRFAGSLPDHIRELVICQVARETGNQFEWQTHAPLAEKAGIAADAISAIGAGRFPCGLAEDAEFAIGFTRELMQRHGVCDATYADSLRHFGPAGTVELTSLIGYFVMICWVMNVARTPGPAGNPTPSLLPFPA